MNRLNKQFIVICLVVLFLLGLTACSSKSASSSTSNNQKVVLTFWKEPEVDQKAEQKFYEGLIKEFEKQHPNIQVNYLQIPWTNAQQKMTAAFTSNTPPDVTLQPDMYLDTFASQNALLPINKLSGTDQLFKNAYPILVNGSTYNGQKYGVPYVLDYWPLVMNEGVWERAGKPKLPETYSELTDFARKLTFDANGKHPGDPGFDKNHIKTYGFMNSGQWDTSVNYFYNYLWSFGSDYLDKSNKDIGFNNSQGKAALDWLKSMQDQGIATPPNLYSGSNAYNDWINGLATGSIAIEWLQSVYPSMMQANPNFKYQVLPAPAGPGGDRYILGTGEYLSIAAKSQHPKEALEFIKFLTSGSNETGWLRLVGFFPPKPMSPDIYNGLGANTEFIKEALKQAPYARPMHSGLKFAADQIIINEMNTYVNGSASFNNMTQRASQQVKMMASNAGQ